MSASFETSLSLLLAPRWWLFCHYSVAFFWEMIVPLREPFFVRLPGPARFYAIYAIASFIWDPGILLWRSKIAYATVLTGTFINRNTAAIYFGACAILWLLLFVRSIFGSTLRILADTQISSLLFRGMSRRAVLNLAVFILLMSAAFMTGSRAGAVLFLLISAGVCPFSLQEKDSSRKTTLGLIAGLVAAGAIVLKIVGSGVDARIGAEGLIDPVRLSVYRAVLRLIADHVGLGTGLGTLLGLSNLSAQRHFRVGDFGPGA
jgi:hypothetical protein